VIAVERKKEGEWYKRRVNCGSKTELVTKYAGFAEITKKDRRFCMKIIENDSVPPHTTRSVKGYNLIAHTEEFLGRPEENRNPPNQPNSLHAFAGPRKSKKI